jgi:hypothetical protein
VVTARAMSLVTVQTWIKQQLDGLVLPGPAGVQPLEAVITPPDPNEDPQPVAYIWPTGGREHRQAVPRNTGPGTAAGWKNFEPNIDIYLTWFNNQDDPYADVAFPSVVDAVMNALRTSPDPAEMVDPNTGAVSWLAGVGEDMDWSNLGVNAVNDQRWLRYDALIRVSFTEFISA